MDEKEGDYVERDEVIAELESEKATFEVNAEKAGVIHLENLKEGDAIKIGDLLARIDETASKNLLFNLRNQSPLLRNQNPQQRQKLQ